MIKLFQKDAQAAGGEAEGSNTLRDRETVQETDPSVGQRRSAREASGHGEENREESASGESEEDSEGDEGPYVEMVSVLFEGAYCRICTLEFWRRRKILRMKRGQKIRRRMS